MSFLSPQHAAKQLMVSGTLGPNNTSHDSSMKPRETRDYSGGKSKTLGNCPLEPVLTIRM